MCEFGSQEPLIRVKLLKSDEKVLSCEGLTVSGLKFSLRFAGLRFCFFCWIHHLVFRLFGLGLIFLSRVHVDRNKASPLPGFLLERHRAALAGLMGSGWKK